MSKQTKTIIFQNKYRKLFKDSSNLLYDSTNSTSSSLNSDNWQDPTILGFAIHFVFDDPSGHVGFDTLSNSLLLPESDEYSAINYLKSINEPLRANYLKKFISLLKSIQDDKPWYFQSISGLGNVLADDPTKGTCAGYNNEITITMLESIDLRISLLIDLYRKAAWDSKYKRWMLPENMKWFKVKIIISEFRDFHLKNKSINDLPEKEDVADLGGNVFGSTFKQLLNNNSVASNVKNHINKVKDIGKKIGSLIPDFTDKDPATLYDETDNSFLPMHIIELDMCEFQFIQQSHPYISDNLTSSDASEFATQTIKFKVGRVHESQYYTLHDIILNDEFIRQGLQNVTKNSSERAALMNSINNKGKIQIHNSSSTNFLKDKLKSVASKLTNKIINSIVANIFLGQAFDAKELDEKFKKQKETYSKILAEKMSIFASEKEKITSEDVKKNIKDKGHASDSSIQKNTNNLIDEKIKESKMPKNIEFKLPDMNVNIANTSIDFNEPDAKTDISDNIGFNENNSNNK